MLEKAKLAEAGGADILICMSNTMHKVLSRISDVISIPFIHIATPTVNAIKLQQLNTVGLIGTMPIMAEDYMRKAYEDSGIDIIVPSHYQQKKIDQIIFEELVKNVVTPESKQIYIDICNDLVTKGAQGIILGCTEIFLLLQQKDLESIPLFNTTELHVDAAVQAALFQSD